MARVTIEPLTRAAATYIAANARKRDIEEFDANSSVYSIYDWACAIFEMDGYKHAAYVDGNPVFAFGIAVSDDAPHRGTVWGFGTDDTPRALPAITRFITTALMPKAIADGVIRVEVRVLGDYEESLSWMLNKLGASVETSLVNYGVNGEAFVQLVWTPESKKLQRIMKQDRHRVYV